tara:strand:+ start:88 stop:852 length:765 start_codon:yes stop_codon:yes gene_type:complete
MLRSRLIPCLLLEDDGLVKTRGFSASKYIGDPINAIRIFNEKRADELVILDISASRYQKPPNFELIQDFAEECKMPLCYGGGIKTFDDAARIISLGVEKVAVSSLIYESPNVIKNIIRSIGSQSLVCVVDIKRSRVFSRYDVYSNNGKVKQNIKLDDLLNELMCLGVGEIIINNIDRDGKMSGFDMDLFKFVRSRVTSPITMLGGAGSLEDVRELVSASDTVGAGCGSLFVLKGKFRAVLISYPTVKVKLDITC